MYIYYVARVSLNHTSKNTYFISLLSIIYFSRYVEWSSHEPEDGSTTFDGDNDIARFISIAAEEDLYVLLRPGPYICGERDLVSFLYRIDYS